MKVKDIRGKKIMDECHDLAMLDLADLMKGESEFIYTGCPVCNTDQPEILFDKEGFKFRSCPECETMFISPRPTKAQLSEYYTNSRKMKYWNEEIFPASEETRKEHIFKPRAQQVIDYCNKFDDSGMGILKGTLMDIGAGFGTFCETIKEFNYFNSVIALEPSKGLAESCRARGIITYEMMVEYFKPDVNIDVITCFELLEHVYDPWKFMQQVYNMLGTKGILVLTTPNIKGWETQTLMEHSTTIGGPGHLNYLNPWSIRAMLHWIGFEILTIDTNGELDADLVHCAINENKDLQLPKMYDTILNDPETKQEFQEFLKKFKMSSNMTVVARKV